MNAVIDLKVGLAGRYRIIKRDAATDEVTLDTGWFDNLILDLGTNRLSTGDTGSVCVVGTGNTAPVVTQTALVSLVGSTTNIQEGTQGVNGASPWYNWIRRRYRFAAGTATGNLSEVGVGWATNQLWSRALIVDGGGSPTTITVLSTEVLDIWYELRLYMNETDVNFQLQIGPVLHTCVLRPAVISTLWANATNAFNPMTTWNTSLCRSTVYSGAIGPITGIPAGTAAIESNNVVLSPYVNNSRQRDLVSTWGLNDGNFVGGIDAARFTTNIGQYQVGFTPPIDKTNTKQLTLTFRWAWARHTP